MRQIRYWSLKARSHDLIARIQFLLVPKIGSFEHSKNGLLTQGSLILKKRMEIEHALFSSDTILETWKALIEREAWNQTVWMPATNFRSQESNPWNRIVWIGLNLPHWIVLSKRNLKILRAFKDNKYLNWGGGGGGERELSYTKKLCTRSD